MQYLRLFLTIYELLCLHNGESAPHQESSFVHALLTNIDNIGKLRAISLSHYSYLNLYIPIDSYTSRIASWTATAGAARLAGVG